MKCVHLTSSVLAAGLLFALAGASAAADAPQVVTFVERAITDAVTDIGEKGDSNGDLLTFANDLFDAGNANKVGTDQGFCVRVAKGIAWECLWTNSLADGQITVQGPFLDKGDSTLAITGGTGAYAGARGQMKLHPRNPEGSMFDFTFEILK
ncbi:MAG: allene oxide cyclase family protein [Thermoanaerobaculia bacterium]